MAQHFWVRRNLLPLLQVQPFEKRGIPQELWRYLVMKYAEATDSQKTMMINCDSGHHNSKKLQDLLVEFDCTVHTNAASVAHGPEYKPSHSLIAGSTAHFGLHRNHKGAPPQSQQLAICDIPSFVGFTGSTSEEARPVAQGTVDPLPPELLAL